MDTNTVLKIIEMLDKRLEIIDQSFEYDPDSEVSIDMGQQVGKQEALEELRDHLQEYIHSLQNAVENDMNRGD